MDHGTWTVTGLGSLGHRDPKDAVRAVLDTCPELPFWPQLPRRAPEEGLVRQGARGLGLVTPLDVRGTLWRLLPDEKTRVAHLRQAVQRLEFAGWGPTGVDALGYAVFLSTHENQRLGWAKGQWIGPGTLAASVVLDSGRSLLEDPALLDAVLDQVFLAVVAQARELLRIADRVHLWLDEPLLTSRAVEDRWPVSKRESWYTRLSETCGPRVVVGVHTCAPPDWDVLLDLGVPLLSFDVWRYAKSLDAHVTRLRQHLEKGWIAWGAVPTELDVRPNPEDLAERVQDCVRILEGRSSLDVASRSLVTPSCGLAGLDPEVGVERLRLTRECAEHLRRSCHPQ